MFSFYGFLTLESLEDKGSPFLSSLCKGHDIDKLLTIKAEYLWFVCNWIWHVSMSKIGSPFASVSL